VTTAGDGGGFVRLDVSGTFTHEGSIIADGEDSVDGASRGSGGGAGGSIYISASTMNGSGSFSAVGGDGGTDASTSFDGGGGGAGRIAIEYAGGTFSFSSGDFSMAGGAAGGPGAVAGATGTVYVVDDQGTGPTTDDDVRIFHGFTYEDTDHSVASWFIDPSADNQYCASAVTPSVTAVDITIDGTLSCSSAGLTSFNWASTGTFTVQDDTNWTISTTAADVDFDLVDGDDQTWTDVTFDFPQEGFLTIDDAVAIALAGNTRVAANVQWTSLTDVTVASTAAIDADTKGCQAPTGGNGFGPDASNVCTQTGTGAGLGGNAGSGAGHGSTGGAGESASAGGATYDSATAPARIGASGGFGGLFIEPGAGGGLVRLDLTGTLTHEGAISVDGGDSADAASRGAGGGAGGSIYISAPTVNGSGTFSAAGGDGGTDASTSFDGGGGGAGRVAIEFNAGTYAFSSGDFIMDGGAAGGAGAGSAAKGTVYVVDDQASAPATDDDVRIFHGFTYEDADISVDTWTIDVSATNQYCTSAVSPSVTATAVTVAGTLSCSSAGLTSFNWSSTGTFDVLDDTNWTISTTAADLDFDMPDGEDQTWTDVTFDVALEGFFTIDDAIAIILAGTTNIVSNVQWTALTDLTLVSTSSIDADLKGCRAPTGGNGFGPDASNVCTQGATGAGLGGNSGGGGGHGGAGGAGESGGAGGASYDLATAPARIGASGGVGVTAPGGAGGLVRLNVSGTFTHNGPITVDGEDSADGASRGSGGGAGGGVYITTGDYGCDAAPTFSALGGDGGTDASTSFDGGGAGGGRIAIEYVSVDAACAFDADADTIDGDGASVLAAGGAAGGTGAVAGASGSLSILQSLSMTAAETDDGDSDGQIDAIVVTFSEDLDGTTVTGSDFSVTSPSYTVLSASETAAGVVTIILAESGSPDTDETPTVNIVGSVSNAGAIQTITSGSELSTDGADPVVLAIETDEADGGDGMIDFLRLTFSEPIDDSTFGADPGGFDVSGYAGESFDTGSSVDDELMRLDFTEGGTPDTDATPSLTYVPGTLADLAGNPLAAFGPTSSTDTAAPILVSSIPADAATDVSRTDDFVLTFSEPMDEASVEAATSLTPAAGALSFTWNGTSEEATIDPADSLSSNTAYSIDVAGTAASSALGDPDLAATSINFTTAGGGGGGGGGGGTIVTPSVTLTDPDAGSTLQANSQIQITWTSQGRVDFVNLYYSLSGGASWIEIARNIPNSGVRGWTVPNQNTSELFLRIEATDQATVFASDTEGPMSIVGADESLPPPLPPPGETLIPVIVRGAQAYIRPNGCRIFAAGVFFPSPKDGHLEPVNEICPDDRITTPSYRTVYYVNGFFMRHPFFNAIMYLTWYPNFEGVKVVTDATLLTMDLGDLVVPKPGTVLVKVPDRPETYALFRNPNDSLKPIARMVESEDIARLNFGFAWADYVIDIPPTMFDLLVLGTPILGREEIDTSTLKRREDLARITSPFTFAFFRGPNFGLPPERLFAPANLLQ
jgi:hypothetical protein